MLKPTGAERFDFDFRLFVLLHECCDNTAALYKLRSAGMDNIIWRHHIHWNDHDVEFTLPFANYRHYLQKSNKERAAARYENLAS